MRRLYWLSFMGLIIGVVLGFCLRVSIPSMYVKYFGVAILAALDSAFGGLKASLEKNFNDKLFISGFFSNTLMAAFIVYVGDRIGVQELYLAAVVAFGLRLFQNIAIIRRHIFKKRGWE